MGKICVGRTRKNGISVKKTEYMHDGGWLTYFGIGGITVLLVLSVSAGTAENVKRVSYDEAVAVMSTAVSENAKEELVVPDKKTYADGEDSIFEDIGEFFASLIFGD